MMSPPNSELFTVETIPTAGRGVIAKQSLPVGTTVLDSEIPAAHVVFRQYRKEVCAHCFEYDRGRSLPVRDNDTGKVFCTDRCRSRWVASQGELGREAWQALHTFVQAKSKAINNVSNIVLSNARFDPETIASAWSRAERQAQLHSKPHQPLADGESKTPSAKDSKKSPTYLLSQRWTKIVDPDILSYLLSGVLCHHLHSDYWREEVLSLAMDEEPYKSAEDLAAYCSAFVQLNAIVPDELNESCTVDVCRAVINAGSHNAFGIRSGSEDGEEYMGYALYPSASYFNHSCNPNLMKRRLGRSWEFTTVRDVQEGEECCITYLGIDTKDLTVAERRGRLKENWGFECMCERCREEAAT